MFPLAPLGVRVCYNGNTRQLLHELWHAHPLRAIALVYGLPTRWLTVPSVVLRVILISFEILLAT